MGSEAQYTSVVEAAALLGISAKHVQTLCRTGTLDAHYPRGRKGGIHFLSEDVLALMELRANGLGPEKMFQVAMRALVSSRRAERKLDELLFYLGITAAKLALDKEAVVGFYLKAERTLRMPRMTDQDALVWAKNLLAITEEYLELVHEVVGDPEPWSVYSRLVQTLAARHSTNAHLRMYFDHAARNLRNVAYFYVRLRRGARAANNVFPGESFTESILARALPT